MVLEQLLYSLPTWVLVILVVGITSLLAAAGVLWVRRTVPLPVLEANNEFQDLIVGSVGVFYAVLVAFVVFIVWDQYRETGHIVEAEANKLGDLLRNAEGYPDPFRQQLQEQVRDYARAVVEEWDDVARGGQGTEAQDAIDRLVALYVDYDPRDERQSNLQSEGLTRLSELREQRRLRLLHVQRTVPGLLWFVLLAGEVVAIGSSLFFGIRNLRAQVILTALMATMMSLALLVIFALDHPFIGDIRVTPEAYQKQIEEAERFLRR